MSAAEILTLLNETKFTKSSRRKNINNDISPFSMIMGYRQWFADKGLSVATKKNPILYEKLKELMNNYDPEFEWTTITLNKNFRCEPHKDGKNIGESYIIGIGNYDGGELNVEGEKINIKNKFYKFNGSEKTHFVEPWSDGDRYSLVFYKRHKW
jgi:hypothetical protein